MKTVVYIDIYFFLNFSVDLICLYFCSAISKKQREAVGMILSATVGGIYSCLALAIESRIFSLILSVTCCIVMYYLAFNAGSFFSLLYGAALLFSVNALFGGIYSALVSLVSVGKTENGGYILLLSAALLFLMLPNIIRSYPKKGQTVVFLKYGDNRIKINCMIDSGNMLKEPISGKSVAVLCEKSAKKLFNNKEVKMLIGDLPIGDGERVRGFRNIHVNTAVGYKKCACVKCKSAYVTNGKTENEQEMYVTVISKIHINDVECLLPEDF